LVQAMMMMERPSLRPRPCSSTPEVMVTCHITAEGHMSHSSSASHVTQQQRVTCHTAAHA
jgi:hypothetical protein